MPGPSAISWDEAAVRAAPGDVRVPARTLPIPPPPDLCGRIVPTTHGSETPEDACATARIAAEILGHRRTCVVVEVDGERDEPAEREAREILASEGFEVSGAQ